MLLGNIINNSFGLLSRQLSFYCWHFRRGLDQRQCQELIQLLYDEHFERLANRIKAFNQNTLADYKQQVGKLLFDHCLTPNRRHQLIQLIESGLVDINVRLDNYGRTLLHRSAYNLDVDLVRILIDNGVNIRLRDYAGNTALHIAIQSYRNGALIFGNESDVVQNLTSIIKNLLEADKNLLRERSKCKRVKLMTPDECNSAEFSSSELNLRSHKPDLSDKVQVNLSNVVTNVHQTKPQQPPSMSETSDVHSTPKDLQVARGKPDAIQKDFLRRTINPILLEDYSTTLVDTRNAFGRTALHYCVLVVGEHHLAHFVNLLISFNADTDAVDSRFKTPLYCLVKRPGISAVRQKCQAISNLLNSGCDDLGLAIEPKSYFTEEYIKNMERDIVGILQSKSNSQPESLLDTVSFERVPSLKHLSRLHIIRKVAAERKQKLQTRISLPRTCPAQLNIYINRKILYQSDLF